ncbi:integrase, catalytic region, zinc finger, CCHC-type containing protein [Tanacetum coccineum]
MAKPSWIDAMQEEIHEFERLQVWELVSCPDKVMLIKLKWIYKVKTDEFGGVLKNKARLVAQGFRQEEGINFEESFAPVLRIEISFFLRLQISQSLRGIFLNQSKYASEIIKKYGLLTSNSVDTPMVEKNNLDEDLPRTPVDVTLYRGMIGSLMYLTSNRPDLIYAVCLCARYQAKPIEKHLNALTNYGFQFNKFPLYCDNKSAIALCCNNVQHSRAKHIDVRYYFIKEQVENRIAELYFVRTEYQLADIFTKPLPRERFNFLLEKLGMRSIIINPQESQQVATRDEKWVPSTERVKISSTNIRLETIVPQKEETFQVVIDIIKNPCVSRLLLYLQMSQKSLGSNSGQSLISVQEWKVDVAFRIISDVHQIFNKSDSTQEKGKGSKGKKTVDESQETVDVSEESEPEPAKKKTSAKRRVKKKVSLSVDDNIISDDPDAALELAKSISKTKAEDEEAASKVHATHARIVTEFVPESAKKKYGGRSFKSVVIEDTPSTLKSKSATSKAKLKGAPSLTPAKQEAADIMQALKESKKTI